MTAIDWTQKPEPWRSLGRHWAKQAAVIACGRSPLPPPRPDLVRDQTGAILREKRLVLGLSQTELAHRVGTSRSVISAAEVGKRPRSAARFLAILAVPSTDSAREAAATQR